MLKEISRNLVGMTVIMILMLPLAATAFACERVASRLFGGPYSIIAALPLLILFSAIWMTLVFKSSHLRKIVSMIG